MPKSKKRRPKNRVLAELPIFQATDAAEARGDAAGALGLIEQDLKRRPTRTSGGTSACSG